MYNSRTISLQIDRPFEDVYGFLAEPRNVPSWASNLGWTFEPLGGTDWVTETRTGRVILRFSEPNAHGILDHAVFREGGTPLTTPMRVVRNAEGSELLYTLYQREGMSDAQFASEAEWIISDFQAVKAMLESEVAARPMPAGMARVR